MSSGDSEALSSSRPTPCPRSRPSTRSFLTRSWSTSPSRGSAPTASRTASARSGTASSTPSLRWPTCTPCRTRELSTGRIFR
ncbi:unnamed protein product [Ectocarpus fasciculatus]